MRCVRVGAALSGAIMAAFAAVPAFAADEPTDGPRPTIIDGDYAQSGPWAARLFANGREQCSSSIIAPRWILTAKHCVDGEAEYTFHIGNLDQTQGEQATAVNVHRSEEADLALVEIDHDVTAEYSPLGESSAVAVGQTVQLYGWGATCTNLPENECQSQLLKVANVEVTRTDCEDYFGGVAVCATRGDGIAAGGDSGGPMFATSPADGRSYQVGVASTSDRHSFTAYTNLTRYRAWIAGIAGV
jgi:secreted trypsin-like serine protease